MRDSKRTREGDSERGREKERKRASEQETRPLAFSLSRSLAISFSQKGIIALTTVIILGAIILAVGISAAFVAQTEISLAGQSDREYVARSLATACVEEALHRLKLNPAYTGGTVPIGTETCTAAVAGSGNSRTITASATSDIFTKSVIVTVSLKTNVAANAQAWHIDSWTEGDPP